MALRAPNWIARFGRRAACDTPRRCAKRRSSSLSPASSGFTLQDWDGSDGGFRRGCYLKRGRAPDQERKKGVPCTEEEHK